VLSLEYPAGQGVCVAGQVVIVTVRVTGTVVTSVDVDCTPPVDAEPELERGRCEEVDTDEPPLVVVAEAGGSDDGGTAHPAEPHAQYDDVVANVDEYVVAGQFDTSLWHDVTT
ncbi:MAG: hypothetical protein Q9225_005187, partial [Loekoesia sp. 1 TL-2023]